jgi:hypothetical protein
VTESEVRAKVEAEVQRAGSMRALAREWNMSVSYLSDFLNHRRGPGPQILDPLGLVQRVAVSYEPGKAEGRRRRGVRG